MMIRPLPSADDRCVERARLKVGGLLVAVACSIAATVLAQASLAQLGITEEAARGYVADMLLSGRVGFWSSHGLTTDFPIGRAARDAYAKLPAGAKGPATTMLYAWTRSYLDSPAFKAAYAEARQQAQPTLRLHPATVEDEVAAKIAELENGVGGAPSDQPPEVIEALRAEYAALFASERDELRREIEERRATDEAENERMLRQWNGEHPRDPMVLVAQLLRDFLDNTGDVDFAARGRLVAFQSFESVEFENPAYDEKPWQWQLAWEFGPEAVGAARTAAAAWLRDIDPLP
jgi:hypothetical protein